MVNTDLSSMQALQSSLGVLEEHCNLVVGGGEATEERPTMQYVEKKSFRASTCNVSLVPLNAISHLVYIQRVFSDQT